MTALRRIACGNLAVSARPWGYRRPRLPSEFLQTAGTASWLVKDEKDGEEDGKPEDNREGRTGHPGDLG